MRRMSDAQMLSQLSAFIDLCFHCINEEDYKEIANRTRLSISTLKRLQSDNLSLDIHYRTLKKLSDAAGLKLELTRTKAKISVQ